MRGTHFVSLDFALSCPKIPSATKSWAKLSSPTTRVIPLSLSLSASLCLRYTCDVLSSDEVELDEDDREPIDGDTVERDGADEDEDEEDGTPPSPLFASVLQIDKICFVFWGFKDAYRVRVRVSLL